MSRQWRETPPGPEQKVLEKLFESEEITEFDTAESVQKRYATFHPFSNRVFNTHFRRTKAKMGGYAKDNVAKNPVNDVEIIPGLGAIGPVAVASSSKPKKRSLEHKPDSDIVFKSAPYVTWVYTDHVKKCDIVCVAVVAISGSRKVDFFLSEDNVTLNVTYIWPSAIYSPEELFRSKLNAEGENRWTIDHPKIHAFKSRLIECGLTSRSLPEASIVIKLPMRVQREAHTCKRSGVKAADGGNIVMLEFEAFQREQIIEDEDTTIVFE